MSCGNTGESSGQSSFFSTNLSLMLGGMSLGAQLDWRNERPDGKPVYIIEFGPHRLAKGIYYRLNETCGGLTEAEDPVEDVESPELERLIYHTIGRLIINGWDRSYWHSYQIMGKRRESRLDEGHFFTPVHLRYAVSSDFSVYTIKKAMIQDQSQRISYPFALSNLISITIREHLNFNPSPLRHFIFYNVENEQAWAAMVGSFRAMNLTLPELPERTLLQEEEEAGARSRTSSKHRSKQVKAQAMKWAWVTINSAENASAWNELHTNNPFTRVLRQVRSEITNLPEVGSYTLIAVTQERCFGEQTYWSALIANLCSPVTMGPVKGKQAQYQPGQPSSSSQRHAGY